jgi:hypothetical protein
LGFAADLGLLAAFLGVDRAVLPPAALPPLPADLGLAVFFLTPALAGLSALLLAAALLPPALPPRFAAAFLPAALSPSLPFSPVQNRQWQPFQSSTSKSQQPERIFAYWACYCIGLENTAAPAAYLLPRVPTQQHKHSAVLP